MAKLILSLEGSVIREIPIDKERITIGRKPQNDIQIENLAVSSEHACIVTILNDSFLEDLGSTNGTLVNGNPIKKHILQNNDMVEIGKYKLKYITEAAGTGQAAADDFEKTMVMARPPKVAAAPRAFSDTQAMQAGAAPAAAAPKPPPAAAAPPPPAAPKPPPAAAGAPMLGAIQILTGPNAGKEGDLVKNLTTLGKPGVQVAVITRRPQGYFIMHVEGANFPMVNGKAVDAQPRQLNDHDVIELAGVKMEFFIKK